MIDKRRHFLKMDCFVTDFQVSKRENKFRNSCFEKTINSKVYFWGFFQRKYSCLTEKMIKNPSNYTLKLEYFYVFKVYSISLLNERKIHSTYFVLEYVARKTIRLSSRTPLGHFLTSFLGKKK